MASEGIQGLYIETRDYAATTAFWASLGFAALVETDHASGQWVHPAGGPYVFIAERADGDLRTQVIIGLADAATFVPDPATTFVRQFEPQHWGVTEALVEDPDGRTVSLQAPLGDG